MHLMNLLWKKPKTGNTLTEPNLFFNVCCIISILFNFFFNKKNKYIFRYFKANIKYIFSFKHKYH